MCIRDSYCGCENRVGTYGPVSITPLSSEACIINIGPASTGDVKMPVSYTHLDVYKRQDWAWWRKYVGTVLASDLTPAEQFDVILLNTFREIPQNEAGHFQGAVSYTHLAGAAAGGWAGPGAEGKRHAGNAASCRYAHRQRR